MRKQNLARLLRGRPDGIFVAPFEQGEIGPDLFKAACSIGLEGMVSKRADRPYRAAHEAWTKVLQDMERQQAPLDAAKPVTQEIPVSSPAQLAPPDPTQASSGGPKTK